MGKIGRIDVFDDTTELWSSYQERLEQFFLANEVDDEKKVPVLLSVVGGRTYSILRDLTSPDIPGMKTYAELTTVLRSHFNPTPIQIAERFRFHKRDQKEGESIRDFNAAIRKLSEHCGFADLNDSLKDRLVCGLRNEGIQKKLLTEKDLTYEKALETAVAMETAARDAMELRKHQSVNVVSAKPSQKGTECHRCKGTNHSPDDCRYKNATCYKCKKKGHIERGCLFEKKGKQKKFSRKSKKKQKVHALDDSFSTSEEEESFLGNLEEDYANVNNMKNDVIWVEPRIQNKVVKMELDTGSAVSIIPLSMYKEHFSKRKMRKSLLRLKTYSGETILPEGQVKVNVEINGQSQCLDLHIVDAKGPALFGRDWLSKLKLDWSKLRDLHFTAVNLTVDDVRQKYRNIFKDELGSVEGIEARIKVKPDSNPVFCKARSVPYAVKPKVEKELDRLVENGILSKVQTSEWATPIVPVCKKDGSVRICGDFKVTVNKVLEVDQYPLPKVEDIFASLAGGEKFSKLDLKSAYLQMKVHENDKKYLTINTHKGLFRYNRLSFGIASAPAIWQRTMDQILQGLEGVKCILDDMIITGKNDQEHLYNLDKVLERLEKFGLRLNSEKCQFFMNSLTFCGHKIDKDGLHKTEEKVKAVVNAKIPENISQLRAFLGLVNYYSRFLPNLATVLRPLHHLLEKNVPWKWNVKCSRAFEEVKQMITSNNVLVHYNPELPVIVSCDASPYGLGAVLSHRLPNGDERPIAYASRTLTSAEKNYSQIDKEALGIVWGVKRFHIYLYGRNFTLVTDHQPLVYDNLMNGWTTNEVNLDPFLNRKLELSVHQGCILWGVRVVIPGKLRKRVLDEIHEGHMGIVKMKAISRSYVWWPGIDADLESIAKHCEGCLSHKSSPCAAPVHPWEWPRRPWQRVHADFAGPFEGTMFLLMVDAHSKWPEIIQMTTTTSNKTIEVMREVFARNGLPECLVSDNGPQFISEEFQSFMKVNGVRHITSAPYHPRTNGQVERLVFTFKQAMRSSRKYGGTLQKRLSKFLLSYRTTPHSTTGEAPAQLFMGRTLQTRLGLIKPTIERKMDYQQEKMFKNDTRKARTFDLGEKVCVRDYRSKNEKWVSGTITSKTGPLSYKVNVEHGAVWRRHTDQILKGDLPTQDESNIPVENVLPQPCETKRSPAVGVIPEKQPPEKHQVTDNNPEMATTPRRYPVRSTRGKAPRRLDI